MGTIQIKKYERTVTIGKGNEQRQKVQKWMEARQARHSTVNLPMWMIRRNTHYALVSSYIMMRASIKSLTKYRYRLKGRFKRRERGP